MVAAKTKREGVKASSAPRKIRVIYTDLNLRNERFPHRKLISDTEANHTALCNTFYSVSIQKVDDRLSIAWVG